VQTLIPIAAAPASPPWPARFAALLRIDQVSIFGLSPVAADIEINSNRKLATIRCDGN
jgi:hypothetical protein